MYEVRLSENGQMLAHRDPGDQPNHRVERGGPRRVVSPLRWVTCIFKSPTTYKATLKPVKFITDKQPFYIPYVLENLNILE